MYERENKPPKGLLIDNILCNQIGYVKVELCLWLPKSVFLQPGTKPIKLFSSLKQNIFIFHC